MAHVIVIFSGTLNQAQPKNIYLFIWGKKGNVHQVHSHLVLQGPVPSHTLYSQNTSPDWINTVICLLGLGSNPRFFNAERSAKD